MRRSIKLNNICFDISLLFHLFLSILLLLSTSIVSVDSLGDGVMDRALLMDAVVADWISSSPEPSPRLMVGGPGKLLSSTASSSTLGENDTREFSLFLTLLHTLLYRWVTSCVKLNRSTSGRMRRGWGGTGEEGVLSSCYCFRVCGRWAWKWVGHCMYICLYYKVNTKRCEC